MTYAVATFLAYSFVFVFSLREDVPDKFLERDLCVWVRLSPKISVNLDSL